MTNSTLSTRTTSARCLTLVTAVAAIFSALILLPASAHAAAVGSCAKWAATSGDDANPGTAAAPYRSLNALVANLAPGQTGCLVAGEVYDATQGNGIFRTSQGMPGAPVTITSGGEGRASVRGWVEAQAAVHDVVVTDLDFIGSPVDASGQPIQPKSTEINLLGNRITLSGNDIANPYGICINAGLISAYQSQDPGTPSDGIVITDNRVHDCGNSPKVIWTDADSGAHGIYLVNTRNAVVTQNIVYDNRYRGFQQWPTGYGTLIANNLFVRNATQINIGSALTDGYPWYSSNTTIRDNILVDKTDYRTDKNQGSIAFNFPEGSPSYGNTVTHNCIDTARQQFAGFGYTASDTISATATFVDAAQDDFTLTADSPCQGLGPASIQPGGGAEPPVTTPVEPVPTPVDPGPAPQPTPTAHRSVTPGSAGCAARSITSHAPVGADNPAGDTLWFRARLQRWNGSAWRYVAASDWLFARVQDRSMSTWTRLADHAHASTVRFPHLAVHHRYRIVQDLEWDSDGLVSSSIQRVAGAHGAQVCRPERP